MLKNTLAMMSENTSALASNPATKRALFWLEFKANALKRPNGRFLAKNEKRLENRLKKSLDAQKQYIIEGLKTFPELSSKGMRVVEKKSLIDGLKRLFRLMPKKQDMVDDMESYAGVVMLRAGKASVQKFNLSSFGINFDLQNIGAVRYMQSLRTLNLSQAQGSITQTTQDEIISAVTDGVMNGATYTEIASRIEQMGEQGVFSAARAQRIAVTELAKAYGFGSRQPLVEYKQRTGRQVWKSWSLVDETACVICEDNAKAGWILLDEKFDSGDDTEPAHPNCRCAVVYRFDDGTGSGNADEGDTETAKPASETTLQTHLELRDGTTVNLPDGYAYHATPESNLESIAADGLHPTITRLDEGASNPDARIYLAVNEHLTGTGVGMDSGNPILRVPASEIVDPAKDPHIPNNLSLFTNEPIPPDVIQIQDDSGNWISLADWMKLP
jgi:hypothetical protein